MQKYPYIRPAAEKDYAAIWSIWMQSHVIRWMSFGYQSLEDFKPRYEQLRSKSDIYVMIDSIENQEQVVGVRRIKYLEGEHSHIAEFCSMGIDYNLQGRGYGKKFYDEFERIVCQKQTIKLIKLTQSGGNDRAFFLAEKKGFQEEAVFPDWLEREGEDPTNHYFVIEKFIYKIIDKELRAQANTLTSLTYKPLLPRLSHRQPDLNFNVKLNDNKVVVSVNDTQVLVTDYHPDNSVIQHIGFLDNISVFSKDETLNQDALRKALIFIAEQGRVKKLELFTSDPKIASLCQSLGFWTRGELIASCYREGKYHNQLGVEYSFFGIKEAIDSLKSFKLLETNSQVEHSLLECKQIVQRYLEEGICDQLGCLYLQNVVYQMVRDSLQLEKLVSLMQQPWREVISQCPAELYIALQKLTKQLQELIDRQKNNTQPKVSTFFQQPITIEKPNSQHKPLFASNSNKI